MKSLFITGLLVISTQHTQAEWINNPIEKAPQNPMAFDNSQAVPWVTPDMMPITWGDCIPVPVYDAPMEAPMTFGSAPFFDMPAFDMPAPVNVPAPAFVAPQTDVFYGNIPAPMPMPALPAMQNMEAASPQCDQTSNDDSKEKLAALQARYNHASAASRNKIGELKQIISDTQNQLQDSVASLENLTKTQSLDKTNTELLKNKLQELSKTSEGMISLKEKENNALKKQLAILDSAGNNIQNQLLGLRKEKDNLQSQLVIATEASGKQAQKLMAFGKSAENQAVLKQQLAGMTATKEDLQQQLKFLLKESTAKLNTIQKAYQAQGQKYAALNKHFSELSTANNDLQLKIKALESDAAGKNTKMHSLMQTSSKLDLLKQAHQTQLGKNNTFKKQLVDLNIANKTLQARIQQLKTEEAHKSKQTNQIQSAENNALNKQLKALNIQNKILQTQVASLKNESTVSHKEIDTLKHFSEDLTSLKQTYQSQLGEDKNLKKQIVALNVANNNLQASVGQLKTESSVSHKEIDTLKHSSADLASLKQTYQTQLGEDEDLKKQIVALNVVNNNLQARLEQLKTGAENEIKQAHQAHSVENDEFNKQLEMLKTKNKTLKTQVVSLKITAAGSNKEIDKLKLASSSLFSLQQTYNAEQEITANLKKQLESCANTTTELESCNASLAKATADNDKDGILDSADKCPSTPTGAKVDASGCVAITDNDKDGISDNNDACLDSPLNSKVNEKGCPAIQDSDKDGIADASDLCPSSVVGATVNEFGCAPTENITLEGVTFKPGSALLKGSSLPILDAAVKTLKSNPNLKIEIGGHTDNEGYTGANSRLSQRRANTVMIYLIRKGIPTQNLKAKGYGEKQPITTNDTKAGRAKNRRVELKILK